MSFRGTGEQPAAFYADMREPAPSSRVHAHLKSLLGAILPMSLMSYPVVLEIEDAMVDIKEMVGLAPRQDDNVAKLHRLGGGSGRYSHACGVPWLLL